MSLFCFRNDKWREVLFLGVCAWGASMEKEIEQEVLLLAGLSKRSEIWLCFLRLEETGP